MVKSVKGIVHHLSCTVHTVPCCTLCDGACDSCALGVRSAHNMPVSLFCQDGTSSCSIRRGPKIAQLTLATYSGPSALIASHCPTLIIPDGLVRG